VVNFCQCTRLSLQTQACLLAKNKTKTKIQTLLKLKKNNYKFSCWAAHN